ncbi:MAG TPA: ABC transporter permease, partial [Treponemataceae bacterium]|nr:ABC transporter permease [Treponemataceae bacterium]
MTGGKLLKNRNVGFRYSLPMGLWFTLFFLLPLAIIISYSFMKKGLHGGVEYSFSLNAYIQMMNASYGKLFVRTLWVTFLATLISIILALPCGYAMARSKNQTLLLFLIIIPFWTNSLIRINAWIAILGNQGFINVTLRNLG